MQPIFDPTSCCQINDQGIATRYIGPASIIIEWLTTAGFAIANWHIVPRAGPMPRMF